MAVTISLSPCTILKTPSGKPASFSNSASRPQQSGTFSEGFTIMQLPSAIALGMVQLGTMAGKLNGTIEATTPSGTCSVLHSTPLLTSRISPVTSWGSEQANSVSSMHFSISARDSFMVLPFSSLQSAASSLRSLSNKYLYLKNTCTLSLIGVLLQAGNAALAAFTAVSRSLAVDIGTLERRFPSNGEITSRVRKEDESTNFPL